MLSPPLILYTTLMKSLFIQHLISSGARACFLAAEAEASFCLQKRSCVEQGMKKQISSNRVGGKSHSEEWAIAHPRAVQRSWNGDGAIYNVFSYKWRSPFNDYHFMSPNPLEIKKRSTILKYMFFKIFA